MRIAGGLLLLGIGIVHGDTCGGSQALQAEELGQSDLMAARSAYRQNVILMAMQLLVGPGVIADGIQHGSEASARGCPSKLQLIMISAGDSVLVLVVLASGKALQRLLDDLGLSFTQRGMRLVVAAIGAHSWATACSTSSVPRSCPARFRQPGVMGMAARGGIRRVPAGPPGASRCWRAAP